MGRSTLELSAPEALGHERIHQLEATAVANAEQALSTDGPEEQRFFLVGYTPTQFWLDHYPLTTLLGHTGQHLGGRRGRYLSPQRGGGLPLRGHAEGRPGGGQLTLEPIAALNAARFRRISVFSTWPWWTSGLVRRTSPYAGTAAWWGILWLP